PKNSGKDSVELERTPLSSEENKTLVAEEEKSRDSIEGTSTTVQGKEWKDVIKHAVNIELDNETSHVCLKISGAKSVSYTPESQNKTSSMRFLCHPCVVGKQSFPYGQHYWEVEVEDPVRREVKKSWRVGVAAASVDRRSSDPLSTEKRFWLFSYDETKGCHANTHPAETVFKGLKLKRLGVLLDCDKQTVSFYNPEQKELLFTHKELCKGAILPLFSPGESDFCPLTITDLK
ncbi:hypothetical protein AAFF_G00060890, partial [Aldrovandia affinis]